MKVDFKVLQYEYAFLVHQTANRKLFTKLVLSYLRFCFELKAAASGLNEDTRRLGYCTVSFPACFVKYLNIISEILYLSSYRNYRLLRNMETSLILRKVLNTKSAPRNESQLLRRTH